MLELAFVLLTAAPEFLQEHAAEIKALVPFLKGKYSNTWAITGTHVKTVLGEPSRVGGYIFVSGGTLHNYSQWSYDKLGIRIIVYSEKEFSWAVPVGASASGESIRADLPENWEVQRVLFNTVPPNHN